MIENTVGTFLSRPTMAGSGERSAQSSMLDLEFGEHSDIGKKRETNEDSHGHVMPANASQGRSQGWFFVLADGVGGHARGEVASQLAVDTVVEGFKRSRANEPHSELLPKLLQQANIKVYEAGKSAAPGGAHMATTMVACSLRHDRAVIAHAGDSRCYLIRRNRATQLTRDHTVANEHVRLGLISAAELADSPNRHRLVRSLGNDLFVNVDVNQTQVIPGDVLLMCCDGMHGALEDSEMVEIVTHAKDLTKAAHELVALANEKDGSDNISVQLIRVKSVERVGMYRGRPYKLR
jgi:protein phosphatase